MGTVYKAEQIRLNRHVALKMLQQEHVSDPTFIKKFLDEARAAAQFNHPNVVTIYEIDVDNELVPAVPFIAMEYLPGGSVQDLLSREKKLSPERALQVITDAARGLEYAEKKSIVHRDIKPDNLMISEEGRIKIGDLGLAKSLKSGGGQAEAPEGVFGTPHYIAPEQALNKTIDHRADIYSLGATFYRVLAGTTPYQGSTVKEIIVNKLKDPPPQLDSIEPSIPKQLVAIVDRMMKKDPAERYASARDLIADLERARRQITGAITGPIVGSGDLGSGSTATAVSSELRRPATPIIVLTGAAAMLLLTLAVVGITLLNRDNQGQVPPAPTTNGEDPGRPGQIEEIARKALVAVELRQKNADMKSEEDIRELIASYGELVKEYPGTSVEAKAKETIVWLEGYLTLLAADQVWSSAEEHRSRFERARDAFGTSDKAKFEEVVQEAEAAMTGYGDLVQRYPDDERVKEAQEKASAVDKALEMFRAVQREWQTESGAIAELIDRRAFGEARTRITAALARDDWRSYDSARRLLADRLRTEAEGSFNGLATEVQTRSRAHDFAGARALIEDGKKWGYADFTRRLADLAQEVDAEENAHKTAELQKVRDGQVALLREAKLRALDAVRAKFDFGGAADLLTAALPGLHDSDLKDAAQVWIRDFEAAEKLHLEMLRRIRTKELKKNAVVEFEKVKGEATPIEANAETITVELLKGASVAIPWKDVKTVEYRQICRLWDHDFAVASALVSTDVVLGMLKEADVDVGAMDKVAQASNKAAAAALRARVTWAHGAMMEEEATERLDQARFEIQRSRWQRALDDLNEISTRLNSTRFYSNHRGEIDTLAESCRDKVKR